MYKDKDKQREANRLASQRRRDKGMTQGMINEGMTAVSEQTHVIPCDTLDVKIANGTVFNNGEPSPPSEPRGPEDYKPQSYKPKRGKDIKTFADLSPDVQQTIVTMAMVDGHIDETVKANRTAIAINYQHLFPDRYHSTGIV